MEELFQNNKVVADMAQSKKKKEQYIHLIAYILHNIHTLNGIQRVYEYAQAVWFDEEGHNPGG